MIVVPVGSVLFFLPIHQPNFSVVLKSSLGCKLVLHYGYCVDRRVLQGMLR